jgi:signal peptidase I
MSIITKLATLAVTLAWLLLLRPAALGGPASYIIVSGTSMQPTLESGDLVVVRRQRAYATGDVVAFRTAQGNVIHRIIGGSPAEGYLLQGDNRNHVDDWRPGVDDVLGRQWLHLPTGGKALLMLQQPYFMAALAGGLTLVVLDKPAQKLRRKAGRMVRRPNVDWSVALPSMEGLLGLAATLGLLCLVLVGGAWYAHRRPLYATAQVERDVYRHNGSFSYSVAMQPSDLYPTGLIGPFSALHGADADDEAPPAVFTRLARGMTLEYTYLLAAEDATPDVQGEMGVSLRIIGAENWSRTLELAAPTPFEGPDASARVWVDFERVSAEISAIEETLGGMLGSYKLAIVPAVRVWGQVGEREIDETFGPAFSLELGSRLATFDGELVRVERKATKESVTRPGEIALAGYTVPVDTARRGTVAGAAVCGALALFAALGAFYGPGRTEADRIRLLHGATLAAVNHADMDNSHHVEVSTMQDLLRVAKRTGQMILHTPAAPGARLFFIHDGAVVYRYTAADGPAEEPPCCDEPSSPSSS